MKKIILALFPLAVLVSQGAPTVDMTGKVERIGERPGSAMLSIFDASPESPDGKWICYTQYPALGKGGTDTKPAQVILRERATGKERVLSDAKSGVHNGVNAIWLDARTIAFQINGSKLFRVIDVESGKKIADSMVGELPHKAFGDLLYFSRAIGNVPKTPAEWGVWELNWKTGALRMVISQDGLYKALKALNPKILDDKIALLHVDPSPDNKRVAVGFRYSVQGQNKPTPILAYFNSADGSGVGYLKNRPMHPLWYDNDTFMGIFTQNKDYLISRYNLAGDRIEKMSGLTTHAGASPDRQWFAGETSYYKPADDGHTRVALFRRGQTKPAAILAEWKNGDLSWSGRAHISCSFSADGQRVYFTRITPDNRSEACVFDMGNMSKKP
jgi:hypothetical protein